MPTRFSKQEKVPSDTLLKRLHPTVPNVKESLIAAYDQMALAVKSFEEEYPDPVGCLIQ